MVPTPVNFVEVLKAAAPIAASLTAFAKKTEGDEKDNPRASINITINNHFYIKTEKDAIDAASKIEEQIVDSINSSGIHYIG